MKSVVFPPLVDQQGGRGGAGLVLGPQMLVLTLLCSRTKALLRALMGMLGIKEHINIPAFPVRHMGGSTGTGRSRGRSVSLDVSRAAGRRGLAGVAC